MTSDRRNAPRHLELLNKSDKHIYEKICEALAAPTNRDRRFKRLDDFQEILEAIELFENIDDDDKWKRCLVCGIFRFDGGIAVNITQLKAMILKCKSSINGSLKRLGYTQVAKRTESAGHLVSAIPYLQRHSSELRKWAIRYHADTREASTSSPSASETELTETAEPEIALDFGADFSTWFVNEPLDIFLEEAASFFQ
jgi:hypothetical protein